MGNPVVFTLEANTKHGVAQLLDFDQLDEAEVPLLSLGLHQGQAAGASLITSKQQVGQSCCLWSLCKMDENDCFFNAHIIRFTGQTVKRGRV